MDEIRRDIVRVLYRLPDKSDLGEGFDFYRLTDEALGKREREEEDLLAAQKAEGAQFDPLLYKLRQLSEARREMDEQMRYLVTYARGFVRPRPYSLAALAHVTGMSISGIRLICSDQEKKAAIASNIHKADIAGYFGPPATDELDGVLSDALAEHRRRARPAVSDRDP